MTRRHFPANGKKRCYRCKRWKQATTANFCRNKQASDGLNYICKKCQKALRDGDE